MITDLIIIIGVACIFGELAKVEMDILREGKQ